MHVPSRRMKLAFVNGITFTRLLAGIASVVVFYTPAYREYLFAIYIYIFWSDVTDGYLARKLKIATKAGSIFDYVVDRLNIFLQIGILIREGVAIWVFLPFLMRDLLYVFVQTYLQMEAVRGTKAVSFIGTISIYLYVLYISLGQHVNSFVDAILAAALVISFANMMLRTYRLRQNILAELKKDLLE